VNVTVLIFAKYPKPGRVNTRLVPPLSHGQAARLHRRALAATCELAGAIRGARIVLAVTPDEDANRLARELPTTVDDCWTQGAGSLGQRLNRATQRAFAGGAGAVILLGADSPTLPAARLRDTVEALAAYDAVIGPSDDGGYYLLGLPANHAALFEDIDWGTGRVADQTRQRAHDEGLRLHELAGWYDIDRPEDLSRAAASLEHAPGDAPLRRALREELIELLGTIESTETDND